jgi:hypothetical protein
MPTTWFLFLDLPNRNNNSTVAKDGMCVKVPRDVSGTGGKDRAVIGATHGPIIWCVTQQVKRQRNMYEDGIYPGTIILKAIVRLWNTTLA